MIQINKINTFNIEDCFVKPVILLVTNLFILHTLFIQTAVSQHSNFEVQSITLKDEMINFSGLCILQDRDGFMWFGSTEGLYQYHGTSIKVYRHDPDNKNSLSGNHIQDLHEDDEGMIWIATRNGLNRFDKYTETFTCFKHDEKDSSSINNSFVQSIAEDKNHRLWFATRYGFCLFDSETETFKNYQIKEKKSETVYDLVDIYSVFPDNLGHLWLNTLNDVYRFDLASGNYERITSIGDNIVWAVGMGKPGYCWFSTNNGGVRYDIQNQSCQNIYAGPDNPKNPNREHVRARVEDVAGNNWFRTNSGIYGYNQRWELIYHLNFTKLFILSSVDKQILSSVLYVDNNGSLWFYSSRAIHQIIRHENNFKVYDTGTQLNNWVNCIYSENKDLIWFGTVMGINRLKRSENHFTLYYGDTVHSSRLPYQVLSLYPDRKGIIWVGMHSKGLFSMIRTEKGERLLRSHRTEAIDSLGLRAAGLSMIKYIFEDNGGRLWIGSQGYRWLHYYDTLKNMVFRVVDNPSAKNKLPERGVIRNQTGADTLWVIGSSGIYKVLLPLKHISANHVMPYDVIKCKLVDEDGNKAENPLVVKSYMDRTGTFWLCSNKGFMKVARQSKWGPEAFEVKIYTSKDGLPTNKVISIQPDDKGNLWLGTSNGLSKFNIESETFTNYFVRHGLPDNEFLPGSAAAGVDGELFFGTIAGMISFYPDSISNDKTVAPVMITEISINDQALIPGKNNTLTKSVSYSDEIELRYNQNNISIKYAILDYNHPEFNQFRYKLEGFNKDWIYAGNRTNVDFSNMNPGIYTFRVTGSNNDGIWNQEGKSLRIIIHRPPWLSWYAWIIYVVLLATTSVWIWRFQQNRLRLRRTMEREHLEKENLNELDRLKTRFFTNISHELRTPLTLILGPVEDLIKKQPEKAELSRNLLGIIDRNAKRLRELINQIMDISKLETGGMKVAVSEGNLSEHISILSNSFLSLAESRHINYSLSIPEDEPGVYFDKDNVEKIVINLISNAFKFTAAQGKISVSLKYKKEGPMQAELIVSDTGKGIPDEKLKHVFERFYQVNDQDNRERKGSGIGLALVKELTELYRGKIDVISEEGKGSIFKVTLPVSKDSFTPEEIKSFKGKDITKESEGLYPVHEEQNKTNNASDEQGSIKTKDKKEIILIVEDNDDMRKYIGSILQGDHQLLYAENGLAGLSKAFKSIPDMIVSDVMMPEMDGIKMCSTLKRDDRTSHIPVILLTAKADKKSKLEGLETGADDYIVKPFDAEELLYRVHNLVEQRKRLREKFRNSFLSDTDSANISSNDEFLNKLLHLINAHIADTEFDLSNLTEDLNMSRAQLFRKVSSVTGQTPNELLRDIRLNKAKQLFDKGYTHITRVMHEIGFNNQSWFGKLFKDRYKLTPLQYIKHLNPYDSGEKLS